MDADDKRRLYGVRDGLLGLAAELHNDGLTLQKFGQSQTAQYLFTKEAEIELLQSELTQTIHNLS